MPIPGPTAANPHFAVLDVETTGLFPEHYDRVIEIAVLRIDSSGKKISEFCSLVDPGRDVGPTYIHGIRNEDVVHAPTFNQVAGDVVAHLAGATIVGHNVSFDARFLRMEVQRIGHEIPEIPRICTMSLSSRASRNLPGRKLAVCCRHYGVALPVAHSAAHDAAAAAGLLIECARRIHETTGENWLTKRGFMRRPERIG